MSSISMYLWEMPVLQRNRLPNQLCEFRENNELLRVSVALSVLPVGRRSSLLLHTAAY